MGTEVLHM